MALSTARSDRENDKFLENSKGGTSVSVIQSETSEVNLIDTATKNIIYMGIAPKSSAVSSSVWQITKIDSTTSVTSIKKSLVNQIWNNRASLTYE